MNLSARKKEYNRKPISRFVIKKGNTYRIVKITDVEWIEASGNYIKIHADENRYMIRNTLKGVVKKLDPEQFFRISRSTVVNIEFIDKIEETAYGNCEVILVNGNKLKMTRNYKDVLNTN
jgi:two-component system LytT family response regulator